jgi:hypothetical protein
MLEELYLDVYPLIHALLLLDHRHKRLSWESSERSIEDSPASNKCKYNFMYLVLSAFCKHIGRLERFAMSKGDIGPSLTVVSPATKKLFF